MEQSTPFSLLSGGDLKKFDFCWLANMAMTVDAQAAYTLAA